MKVPGGTKRKIHQVVPPSRWERILRWYREQVGLGLWWPKRRKWA